MESKDRLIRLPEVLGSVGLKKTTVYDMVKRQTFPAPHKLGRTSVWSEREVQEWIETQKAA